MRDPIKLAREMKERKEAILTAAFRLFSERSIESVTTNDIAKEAHIGVATLFRYYKNKQELAIEVAETYWSPVFVELNRFRPLSTLDQFDAIDRLRLLMDVIIKLYTEHPELLRFLHYFESYIRSEPLTDEEYARVVMIFLPLYDRLNFMNERAKVDHSIRDDLTNQEIMYTLFYPMLSTATRYCFGTIEPFPFEHGFNGRAHLEGLKEVMLAYCTNTSK